jgi:hypothetical protein
MNNAEPKKIRFGLSIIQGFAGGMLGGYAYLVLCFSQTRENELNSAFSMLPTFLLTFAIAGCFKATLMWCIYRLLGKTLPPLARLATATFLSPLVLVLTIFYFEFSVLAIFLIPVLCLGVPVALLVGSGVKPWELFTFGSIAAGEVDHRVGSRNFFATIGSLPLRFLGIATVGLVLLSLTSGMRPLDSVNQIFAAFLAFLFFGAYPGFSAYVTFRSPRKIVLAACGVIFNIPIALIGLYLYSYYDKPNWLGEFPLFISALCGSFLIAWLIFLVARLTVKIGPAQSLSVSNNKSIADAPSLDHKCLGSRFVEWQQRVA